VVDAVDQRNEVALAHVPPQLVPLVGRFQARPSARTARLPASVPFPGAAAPQRVTQPTRSPRTQPAQAPAVPARHPPASFFAAELDRPHTRS
jgi:hypothetical protein